MGVNGQQVQVQTWEVERMGEPSQTVHFHRDRSPVNTDAPVVATKCGEIVFTECSLCGATGLFISIAQKKQRVLQESHLRSPFPGCRTGASESARWPISRVLSSPAHRRRMAIHLGRPLPDASCSLPGRPVPRPTCDACAPRAVPIWPCSQWGLPCRPRCRRRGALLPHPFTLAGSNSCRRFAFCGTFPGVAPAGCYPAPCLRGARTFLHRGQAPPAVAIRPSGLSDIDGPRTLVKRSD